MHNDIRKIFKEESQNYFDDRLKWKTDSMQQIE